MNIFDYKSYKTYLKDYFSLHRGIQTQIAQVLNCQASFISQVITGQKTHFSLEHIKGIGEFIHLQEEELDYLLLLCLYEKAGSIDLEKYLLKKLKEARDRHLEINQRITKRGPRLTDEAMAIYYSHWSYMAIHMAVSLPELRTLQSLSDYFQLDQSFTSHVLIFLTQCGLLKLEKGEYSSGEARLHLKKSSPYILSLHQNWRQKALMVMPYENDINTHYSSVLVLSKKDAEKIKKLILQFIEEKEKILRPSKEEQMMVLNLDYFKL